MAEYGLMLSGIGGNLIVSLGASSEKVFQNPLLFGLIVGGILLAVLWAFKVK